MSKLEEFAKFELERAGLFAPDSDYGGALGEATMRLVKVFAAEGHSGFSAGMAVKLFEILARFEPLTPLIGDDDEWIEVGADVFQNRRCPHVFKEHGLAYDSEGLIFREADGACYTSVGSRVPIEFPYTPKREYIDVAPAAKA